MQVAEKLFSSRWFHEITLDHVIEEAHVGKGMVYRCFRDKDDLFFQTATRGFDELCALLGRSVRRKDPFADQLPSGCREIVAFFARRRQLFQMMQSEEACVHRQAKDIRRRWMERRKDLVSAVAGILRKGVREGEVRRDIPPEVIANFLLGMLRTRAKDLPDLPEESRSIEMVISLFRDGAGQEPALPASWRAGPAGQERGK